ncbi:hypothetical protein EVAR_2644_1 [Eumeta japonica]|uniref:Uncharacterized protein n=1 Tax=Eumeta variegata TaxID=151549 RepID=A0A4C1SM25_EUMVA|nr:hypothetical protein EVAR_2644_1 [Eumeta japonica]
MIAQGTKPDLLYGFLGFSPGPRGFKGPPAKSTQSKIDDMQKNRNEDGRDMFTDRINKVSKLMYNARLKGCGIQRPKAKLSHSATTEKLQIFETERVLLKTETGS